MCSDFGAEANISARAEVGHVILQQNFSLVDRAEIHHVIRPLRILQDQNPYRSLCNLVHRSLHQKSIMGTPLSPGSAFQWA